MPTSCAAASRASASSRLAFADSALSIGRIGTETASSFERNADAFFTASALNGAGDHCPMTAPEMIGPEYSSCTPPSGGRDPSAEQAARPTRRPSRSVTAGSPWWACIQAVSPHAPRTKTHTPPTSSSRATRVAPGQSGERRDVGCPACQSTDSSHLFFEEGQFSC